MRYSKLIFGGGASLAQWYSPRARAGRWTLQLIPAARNRTYRNSHSSHAHHPGARATDHAHFIHPHRNRSIAAASGTRASADSAKHRDYGLALFLTMLVMAPTWTRIQDSAVDPYMAGKLAPKDAVANAQGPLRDFMLRQTRREDIEMARGLLAKSNINLPTGAPSELPFYALVPAFVSSELTSAFRVGFLIFLPFLVIDLVVAAVLMGLGMFMLPPTVITIPLKLLIFVLASGWPLLLGNLGASFS